MIVVDACIVANAVADDGADGDRCRALLSASGRAAAPDMLDVEVLSVLRRMWLGGSLDDDRLTAALNDLAELPLTRWPTRHLTARAAGHRANLHAHDAVYVALAEVLEAELVTADRRVANAPGLGCAVRLLD